MCYKNFLLNFGYLYNGVLFYLLVSQPTVAQSVPDTTLPNNSVVPPNCTDCEIAGGTTVGNNLFHSFNQFSIPTDGTAYFNNAVAIENIITRVTGQSISNIDGVIHANGTANLFLLNPNGIIFGSNASLDIGGSFLASTASSLKFADDTEFSATDTQTQPLLTISLPIGLQFGDSVGRIVTQSQASLNGAVNSVGLPAGLQVRAGRTLALLGGDVVLERGNITAEGGGIELGSVASNNLVRLSSTNQGWVLGYEGIQNFQNISLSQAAIVDTSGDQGGDIQIQGRRVTLTGGSQVVSSSLTRGIAGDLRVSASESVELVGVGSLPDGELFPSGLFAEVDQEATGEGATLTIETRQLNVRDGAEVSTTTFGAGRGVDLVVRASESVELEGTSLDAGFASGLFAQVDVNQFGDEATGKGGTLTIETRQLNVRDGAQVATTSFSSGSAGDLRVSALDSVELVGTAPDQITPSGLFAQVDQEATGDGGKLAIETGRLTLLNGAQISSSTQGNGQGGTLTINASDSVQVSGASPAATLTVGRSGIFVSAEPGATGDAGTLKITTGLLTVDDGARISADNFGTGQGGTATLHIEQLIVRDGGTIRAASFNEGPAGDLNITTRSLNVRDGALVSVSGEGTGPAGDLTITASSIRLDGGRLTAETQAGSGANINLEDVDLLLMRDQSLISAQAFNDANGGDISIKAENGFIVAVPGEDSDIIANASEGRGGNIQITTQSIFGIEERRAIPGNGTNDIDASSQFGVNGEVAINTPDFDPSQGLVNLPNEPVNVEVAQGCQGGGTQASVEFFNTGRGGLAPNPYEPISSSELWEDVQLPTQRAENPAGASRASTSPATPPNEIVEAQGWLMNEKGQVVLLAQMPATHSQRRCRLR